MKTDPVAIALILLGLIFLASLAADILGRRTRLPRVTLLLLLGVCIGPLGLDVAPEWCARWFPFIANIALLMVAFLLGGELTLPLLRDYGRAVIIVSLVVVVISAGVVASGLLLLGWPIAIALLLGAIATSTDPAAVSDVVHEAGANGPFSKTLLGVVAVDDAWGIMAMSVMLAIVLGTESPHAARIATLEGLIDLGGAIGIGCVLGLPMALLTGRIRAGEPTQAEALGGVMLCGGLALALNVSFLLAAMTMGVVVANLARHHRRPFRAIEGIEWPFMVLFFVLSGASLSASDFAATASLTLAYVILRIIGRGLGGRIGARYSGRPNSVQGIGLALLPQSGIAIGMALFVSERLPEFGASILTATVAGTIFFEIFGPILTRLALVRIGEGGNVST